MGDEIINFNAINPMDLNKAQTTNVPNKFKQLFNLFWVIFHFNFITCCGDSQQSISQ